MDGDVDRIIGILKGHRKDGLALEEIVAISGLARSVVVKVFDELEDSGKLKIKSDGLSRIYGLKR